MDDYTVICPYCGGTMKHTEPHVHTTRCGVGVMLQCHFYCPSCRSSAPWVDDTYDSIAECVAAAYNVAINRVN